MVLSVVYIGEINLSKLQTAKMQCVDIVIVSVFCLCIFAKRAKNGRFEGVFSH